MVSLCDTNRILSSLEVKYRDEVSHIPLVEEEDTTMSLGTSSKLKHKPSISHSCKDLNEIIEKPTKRRRGWMDFMRGKAGYLSTGFGRIQGSILNKIVQSGMQTPLVKYLLNPHTLKKGLNNDPILSETYKIIYQSEPVQNLLTPEAFQIILDSETAKNVLTPENILLFLNHDLVTRFLSPENISFIFNSDVLKSVWSPEAVKSYLDSTGAKAFLSPEVMHSIGYSDVFTNIMTPDTLVGFVNSDAIKSIMTPEAIKDALECPGAKQTMTREMPEKLLATEGAANLLNHEGFRNICLVYFLMIFKELNKNNVDT